MPLRQLWLSSLVTFNEISMMCWLRIQVLWDTCLLAVNSCSLWENLSSLLVYCFEMWLDTASLTVLWKILTNRLVSLHACHSKFFLMFCFSDFSLFRLSKVYLKRYSCRKRLPNEGVSTRGHLPLTLRAFVAEMTSTPILLTVSLEWGSITCCSTGYWFSAATPHFWQ